MGLFARKVSDVVRDQMMRHNPKWATFNSIYINEKVEFDQQNAVLDEPMEDGLIKFLTYTSIMRDPRASYDMLSDEVLDSLPPDPKSGNWRACRNELKNGKYRLQGSDNENDVRQLAVQILQNVRSAVKLFGKSIGNVLLQSTI
jgi:hypothetical protein